MAKIRVSALAKELGKTSKELLAALKDAGEYVSSASSTLEAPVERMMREKFKDAAPAAKSEAPAKPAARPTPKPAADTAPQPAAAAAPAPAAPAAPSVPDQAAASAPKPGASRPAAPKPAPQAPAQPEAPAA
ncbi:translation initiation factor IF-2 N-terminal domain-containing protein, partial [Puerhibacterium puerhi]|uniref:translation initiation factor IF-2 N-terminal domain-containing protein n=1 Tax=Puerhibacterium puerhi TaxID=2692623 RepID=UPI001914E22B